MSTTICDECGKKFAVGDWPFCPHGKPTLGMTTPFPEHVDRFNFPTERRFTTVRDMDNAFKADGLVPRGLSKHSRSDKGRWI